MIKETTMDSRDADDNVFNQSTYIEMSDESEPECSSKKEEINFAKLCRLVLFICNQAARRVLKKHLATSRQPLHEIVNTYRASLHPVLTRQEYQQLFFAPTGKTRMNVNVDKLGFTVVYKLLIHVFNLPPHEMGWGQIPRLGDQSTSACLDRIFSERSAIFSHSQDGVIDNQRFEIHWENLSGAILQMERNEFSNEASIFSDLIQKIYHHPLDDTRRQTYIKQLRELQEEEKDLKHYSVVLKGKMGSLKEHYEAIHQDEMQMKQVLSTFTGSIRDMKNTFQNAMRDQTDVLVSYITGRDVEDDRMTSDSEASASDSYINRRVRKEDAVPQADIIGTLTKDMFDRNTCHFDCIMDRGGAGISTAPEWLPQLPTENLKSLNRLKYYRGVLAKKFIRPQEIFSFEVDAKVEILEHYIIDNSTIYEFGLCDKNELDKNVSTTGTKNVYSVRVFVCEKHASICLSLCNNMCLFHSELVPFSDQLIYSNNWKLYIDLQKMYMAVFSGNTLIHWQSHLTFFQNMHLFLGIGQPKDMKCSINIKEFNDSPTDDILECIRKYHLDSPHISDYLSCEDLDIFKGALQRTSSTASMDSCIIQRLPFLELESCKKHKLNYTKCSDFQTIAQEMKSYLEFLDWVGNFEKVASDLMSMPSVPICAVVNIRSIISSVVKIEYLKESSKRSSVINEVLYETALGGGDVFLCQLLISHDIPFVSESSRCNPLRLLCNDKDANLTPFIEGFIKSKIEKNSLVTKTLRIDQTLLTRNNENDEFCVIVYLGSVKKCPFSSVNGLNILWQSSTFVNREGRILAERMNKEFEASHSDLPQIPGDIAAKLFEKHSNLTMISVCPFRSKNFNVNHEITREPCIVLYCRSKGKIPIAEEEFPRRINNTQVDIREGFCCFGVKKDLKVGQQIYVKHDPHLGQTVKGTLGGFVELPDKRKAILTCAHLFFGINDLHGNRNKLNIENKFISPDNSTGNCGTLKEIQFRHNSPRETSVDAALVEMNENYEHDLTISDFKQTDIDPTGTTHQMLTFEAGISWNQIPSMYMWNPVLKYGAESKLTCGNLSLQNGHFQIESHMVDICEDCRCLRFSKRCMHNKFRFFHQMEVYSKTSDNFFEQGDSGALVFMLGKQNDPTLHCVGMAIGLTTNGSCIVTPIWDIFNAFGLERGFVKSLKSQVEIPATASSSKGPDEPQDSMSKVLTILTSMNSSINDVKESVKNLESDNVVIKKKIERLEDRNKEDNSASHPSPKRKKHNDS